MPSSLLAGFRKEGEWSRSVKERRVVGWSSFHPIALFFFEFKSGRRGNGDGGDWHTTREGMGAVSSEASPGTVA